MEPPKPLHKYALHIMYDGTNYSGWQIQPNAISIQELLQKALHTLLREETAVVGSGRTDAGVHAIGQVAHFISEKSQNVNALLRSLNGMLPYDIRISALYEVPLNFHAQKSAIRKEYHYKICLLPFVSPFERQYSLHVPFKIDIPLLKEAAKQFLGTHDFTTFANAAHEGAAKKNPVRTLYRLDVIETESGLRLEFEGNGFLYKMVRNIVGMLLHVASHKRSIDEIATLFAAKDRRQAPMAAGAKGLFLIKVTYE